MTGGRPSRGVDAGPSCVCGHPEHAGRCPCGCRSYVSAGSHADQSRGGRAPAAVALVCFVLLVGGLVVVLTMAVL